MFRWLLVAAGLVMASCGGAPASGSGAASSSNGSTAAKPAQSAVSPASQSAGSAAKSSQAAVASPASSAGAKQKMTVAYAAVSVTQLPAWVAKEQGFFDQNGLDVELTSIAGGSSPTAALLSGQVQALQISTEIVQAGLNGGDLEYIIAPTTAFMQGFYVVPSIKSGAELKGKKIGATGIGTATYSAAKLAVKSFGLDPQKDVTILSLNNTPDILKGMESGSVDAGSLSIPTSLVAQKAGMKLLVDLAKLDFPFPSAWHAMSKKYVEGHKDVVQRYTKSILQAIAFEIQHPRETQQILGKYTKTTDQGVLTASYQSVAPYLRKTPTPDPRAIQDALDELVPVLPQAKTAKPESFFDDSFVKELDASGFIASLYK